MNSLTNYYALNGDSTKILIKLHSYNVVDIQFKSTDNKTLESLLNEIKKDCESLCFGDAKFLNSVNSLWFNGYRAGYNTKIISYVEKSDTELSHIVIVSTYNQFSKEKHTKYEGKNNAEWYSICGELDK